VDQSVWWPSFRLDDRIRFPPGREFLPSIHWATGSLASKVKRIGREAKNLTLIWCLGYECVELCLHSPLRRHGVVRN
jgi:hypothetical protein